MVQDRTDSFTIMALYKFTYLLTYLCLQRQTNSKSYYDLSKGAIFSDLERPLPPISRSHHYLMLNISKKRYEIQTQFQWNTNRDLHTPYLTVSFQMTLSDLESLSEIFSDTKRRAKSRCAKKKSRQPMRQANVTGKLDLTEYMGGKVLHRQLSYLVL